MILMTKFLSVSSPLVLASLLVASDVLAIPAATLLTFEDSVVTGLGGPPQLLGLDGKAYAGFQWLDFASVNAIDDNPWPNAPSGINMGVVSPNNVLMNYGGANARFMRNPASPFDFNSVYLTSAFYDGMSVRVLGFANGQIKYDRTVVVDTLGPTFFTFNYLGVDKVQFDTGFGGVLGAGFPNVPFYVVDNLSVTTVPDGSGSGLLLGTALVGLCFFRRMLLHG